MNCILVLSASRLQEFFPLEQGLVRIGRESDNDIQLLDDTVSRHHANISNMPNVCELQDNNSANGTFVNGKRIQSAMLRHGDEVRFGETIMRFETLDHEIADDIGHGRDYSAMSQHSTVRVKRHPADASPTVDQNKKTSEIPIPKITIKRKGE